MTDNKDHTYIYGIDLGSYYTVVSKCIMSSNNCKIDILQNCLFHRLTPNCVVVHDKQYFTGDSAQRLQKRYNKEYYTCDLSYLGRKKNETEEERFTHYPMVFTKNDPMQIRIKEKDIAYEELLYFLLTDAKKVMTKSPSLREEIDLRNYNNLITISVPSFFNNNQKSIIQNIGELIFNTDNNTKSPLRGVNTLKTVKKTSLYTLYTFEAIAYTYGYENNLKFTGLPSYRLFIDMGYSCCTCFLVKYTKDECKIESCYYDESIGGKFIDVWLYKRLEERVRIQLPEVNLDNNVKFKVAIKNELMKSKEKLSAAGASEVVVRIELGEDDFEGTFSVKDIEDILIKEKKIDEKIINLTTKATSLSSLSLKDFQIVVVGGSMRIPCIQKSILNYWSKRDKNITSLTYTLNMDEAVACGCVVNSLFSSTSYKFNSCKVGNINQTNTIQDDNNYRNRNSAYYESLKKFFIEIEYSNNMVIEGSKLQNDYEALLYKYQHMFEEIENSKFNKQLAYLLEEIKVVHNKPSEDAITYYNTHTQHLNLQLAGFLEYYNTEKENIVKELKRAINRKEDKMIGNLSKIYNPMIENPNNYSIPQIKEALKEVNTKNPDKIISSSEHYSKQEDIVDNTIKMGKEGRENFVQQQQCDMSKQKGGSNPHENHHYRSSHHGSKDVSDGYNNSGHQQQFQHNGRNNVQPQPCIYNDGKHAAIKPPSQHHQQQQPPPNRASPTIEETKHEFIARHSPEPPVRVYQSQRTTQKKDKTYDNANIDKKKLIKNQQQFNQQNNRGFGDRGYNIKTNQSTYH